MKKRNLKQLILTGIFSSLCFVATFIQIPLPTGGMIHLGNYVCIIIALIYGPLIGGLAGSIGMGLFDIIGGYPLETYIRSFILKFLMGFIAGSLNKRFRKTQANTKFICYLLALLFTLLAIVTTIIKIREPIIINTSGTTKEITINILIPIFAYIYAFGMIILTIITRRKKIESEPAIVAGSIALLANIIFEFFTRIVLKMTIGFDFRTSYYEAIVKLPASILTSVLTIVLIFSTYAQISKSIDKLGLKRNEKE